MKPTLHQCGTPLKVGYEWDSHYYYCPKCRVEVSEKVYRGIVKQ